MQAPAIALIRGRPCMQKKMGRLANPPTIKGKHTDQARTQKCN